MVDLFHEDKVFFAYQGAILKDIFENIITSYQINFSKLLRYAERRKIKPKLIQFLENEHLANLEGLK